MATTAAQRGYTYVVLLIVIAMSGAAAAAVGKMWATAAQREKERELLFRGEAIAHAIESYRAVGRDGAGARLASLDALVVDKRGPATRHHLRRLYVDPFTGRPDWVLIADPMNPNAVVGVHSRARTKPLLQNAGPHASASATCVCDWRFVVKPISPPASAKAPQ